MTTLPIQTSLTPPGPRAAPLVGNLFQFTSDPLGFLTRCAREYGDVVRLTFANTPVYLLSNPADIEQMMVTNNRNFAKTPSTGPSALLFGTGMLTSEGEHWLRQRRLAQPAFHRERIAVYGAEMVALTERTLDGWRDGQPRDLLRDMMHLTLQIVVKTLFGADIGARAEPISAAFDRLIRELSRRIGLPLQLPLAIPTPGNLRFRRAVGEIDAVIYALIRERRAAPRDRDDLLSMLLHARDEDGSGMSDRQLRDELMTLFLAGHETTALALTWAWYLLAEHPDADAALSVELREVLGGRAPTLADLPRLRYSEMVIREAMRLYPPAWIIDGRRVLRDCTLGGYPVPAGALVATSQWIVHRDPRLFDDPLAFRPERWAGEAAQQLPRFAYFPFGGGPRVCIGQPFAMMEATLLLATIARRFRPRLATARPVTPMPSITLRPRDGLPVIVGARA